MSKVVYQLCFLLGLTLFSLNATCTNKPSVQAQRQFMKRQYQICLLQVAIYNEESDLKQEAELLSQNYRKLAVLRSQECLLMKKTMRQFEQRLKQKHEHRNSIPNMTLKNRYIFKNIQVG